MTELLEQVAQKAGISAEQAQKAVEAIAEFVKEKFPMLGGAVDQIFQSGGDSSTSVDKGTSGLGGFGL